MMYGALIFIIFTCYCNQIIETIRVTVEQGQLDGQLFESRNGTKFYGFLGVPFAKPPIGDLRFEPPQEPDSWDGVRKATDMPPSCIQKEMFMVVNLSTEVVGDEDCLYLNVYTPTIKSGSLPVMVFIHGGGFITGGVGLNDPEYVMDNAVVLVFIQYRLNVLGFLSAADNILPGNYGMKDQVAALKWVQKNVAAFGGNPQLVTIFGHSAGSASVHFHLYSPLSKGLFHRAISQSGSSLGIWAVVPSSVARAKALSYGIMSGCPVYSVKAMVRCLKQVPAKELVLTLFKFFVWNRDPVLPLAVVIESSDVEGAFITENPWKQKLVNNVPWIIGTTDAEGGVLALKYLSNNNELVTELNHNYKRLFPIIFYYAFWYDAENIVEVTESLKKFYFKDEEIGVKTAKQLIDLFTDGYFTYDCMEAALRYEGKVYFYYYEHQNSRSFSEVFGDLPEKFGACHGDDLLNIFYMPLLFDTKVTEGNDFAVSQRIIKRWINFAYTGNPNDEEELWTPVNKSSDFEYLRVRTKKDEMKKNLLKEIYTFWKNLPIHSMHLANNKLTIKDEL